MENMKDSINKILVEVNKEIGPYLNDSNLISNGRLDSLDIMNLIMMLEEKFDIEIDPEDVLSENFESIEAIIALIEKCRS